MRILYDLSPKAQSPAVMAVSVPKRLFKRAVDRNLLKRRIRESYRLQKPGLYAALSKENVQIQMVIQYRGTEIADFGTIHMCLEQLLRQVSERISKNLT